jgi:OOP family OmpA-OmpF porin
MKTYPTFERSKTYLLPSSAAKCAGKFFITIIGCLVLMQAKSQTDKRLVLADQYFANGEYFTAAGLYGQFLHPAVKTKTYSDFPLNSKRYSDGKTGKYGSKTDIVFKQAESYRLANYWTEAANLYKECLAKDSLKYSAALYWIAVCQRSLGDYASAEESLNRFFKNYGTGAEYYNAASQEKQRLQFIKTELSKPDSLLYHTEKIATAFETSKGVFAPVSISGSQFLFTSTQTDSVAAGNNPYHNRLFSSVLNENGLQSIEPVNFEFLDSSLSQGAASVSPNGKHLYFTQWKKEDGQVLPAIYVSNKTSNGWSKPQLLPFVNQQGRSSKQPFCSADGKFLFFASDRKGSKGGFDIWYAPLKEDGTTGESINAGSINTSENEQSPFYHSSTGTIVFASDRMPGMGGYDLFMSNGSGTDWKTPENMGYPINSSRDDVYFFAKENDALLKNAIVSSDRGSECCLATYTVSKTPKKKMITGVVLDCASNEPLADAEVVLRDAAGNSIKALTNADGRYSFDVTDEAITHQFFASKEKYNEKMDDVLVEGVNTSNWQTDTLHNTAICLEKKFVLKVENVVTVYFDFDRSNIKERGAEQLDSIYTVLMENPSYTLQISGYTDGKGSVEYNKKLSDRRAKSCADYLIEKGIDPSRISFESFGACCPVEMELINGRDNAEGRSKNRRALININKE